MLAGAALHEALGVDRDVQLRQRHFVAHAAVDDHAAQTHGLGGACHQVADIGAAGVGLAGHYQHVAGLALVHGDVDREVVAVLGVDGVGGAEHYLAFVQRHQVGVHAAVARDAQALHAVAQLRRAEFAKTRQQVVGDQVGQGEVVFSVHGGSHLWAVRWAMALR